MIELTDVAAQDLGRVLRAAPLPDKGTAKNNCAQLDGHYRREPPSIFMPRGRLNIISSSYGLILDPFKREPPPHEAPPRLAVFPDDDPSRDIAITQPEIDSRPPHVAS